MIGLECLEICLLLCMILELIIKVLLNFVCFWDELCSLIKKKIGLIEWLLNKWIMGELKIFYFIICKLK